MTERQKSDRHEAKLAKTLGGKRVRGSGSGEWHKEDIVFPGLLMQDKRTATEGIRVTRTALKDLADHAENTGRFPAFSLSFEKEHGWVDHWVALPIWVLETSEFWERLKQGKND